MAQETFERHHPFERRHQAETTPRHRPPGPAPELAPPLHPSCIPNLTSARQSNPSSSSYELQLTVLPQRVNGFPRFFFGRPTGMCKVLRLKDLRPSWFRDFLPGRPSCQHGIPRLSTTSYVPAALCPTIVLRGGGVAGGVPLSGSSDVPHRLSHHFAHRLGREVLFGLRLGSPKSRCYSMRGGLTWRLMPLWPCRSNTLGKVASVGSRLVWQLR
jgi:hypothetical protein